MTDSRENLIHTLTSAATARLVAQMQDAGFSEAMVVVSTVVPTDPEAKEGERTDSVISVHHNLCNDKLVSLHLAELTRAVKEGSDKEGC